MLSSQCWRGCGGNEYSLSLLLEVLMGIVLFLESHLAIYIRSPEKCLYFASGMILGLLFNGNN